jgi:hypothetical protein
MFAGLDPYRIAQHRSSRAIPQNAVIRQSLEIYVTRRPQSYITVRQ